MFWQPKKVFPSRLRAETLRDEMNRGETHRDDPSMDQLAARMSLIQVPAHEGPVL